MKSISLFSPADPCTPSHTALYCWLCNAYTPPEGNSSSRDRRNLINNHSHFYFALSLILTSLHSLNLRHSNQNFIKKKKKWALEYHTSLHNIWNSNKKIKFNVLIIHCVQEIKVALSHNYSMLRQWKRESHLCCHNITNFTLYLTTITSNNFRTRGWWHKAETWFPAKCFTEYRCIRTKPKAQRTKVIKNRQSQAWRMQTLRMSRTLKIGK